MKRILFFLLFLTSLDIAAQTEIKGLIIEKETQDPLEFAEIILFTDQSSDLIGVVTDAQGVFHLNASSGEYKLQVTYVGQVLYTKDLSLTKNAIDLGTIEIVKSQKLDEVIIEATKKLIERKIDRLVFNIENLSKASQGDALEVLKVTPGVRPEFTGSGI